MPTRLSRQLRRAVLLPHGPDRTDGELLKRFVLARDEAAFEALLHRHGRMVLGVCRRLLGDTPDAEDAFQATFLVFVRKAASLHAPEAVGSWLYGVAYRTALEARVRKARRQAKEQKILDMPQPWTDPDSGWAELLACLDKGLTRLPDKYRLPVVLCELEGRSRKDVARQLQLPEGTLSSRLATARKLLARRLAHQGVALSAATLAVALQQNGAPADVPGSLLLSTLDAATGQTAIRSAQVAALMEGTVKAMFLAKLRIVSGLVFVLAMLGAGAGGLTYSGLRAEGQKTGESQPSDRPKTLNELDHDLDSLATRASTVQAAARGIRKAVDDLKKHTQDRQTELEALEDIERFVKEMKAIVEREKSQSRGDRPASAPQPARTRLQARVEKMQWSIEEVNPVKRTISIQECISVGQGGFGLAGGLGFAGGGLNGGGLKGQLGGGTIGGGGISGGLSGGGFGGLGGTHGGLTGQAQLGFSGGQFGLSGGASGALTGNLAVSGDSGGFFTPYAALSVPLRMVEIPVAGNARITINGKRAALVELTPGMRISVQLSTNEGAVTRIAANWRQLDYVVESVDLPRHTLSIRLRSFMPSWSIVLDRLEDMPVDTDAEVMIDKKEAQLADLRKGMSIALDLTVKGGKVVVKRIRAEKD
jgi:RNA polymerase sigma factor (sigma-70 family)